MEDPLEEDVELLVAETLEEADDSELELDLLVEAADCELLELDEVESETFFSVLQSKQSAAFCPMVPIASEKSCSAM